MITGLVSTVIPVYNRPEMLLDAVSSVIDQHYRPIEIIIINDGSTDNTLEVARQLEQVHDCISVVNIDNSGPAVAREKGRERARGEFIQYLDSDDLLHPDKFTQQVTALNNHTECGVSYCVQKLCHVDGTLIESAWMRSGTKHSHMFPAMLGGRIWGTPVPLYRSELLQKAGPWLDLCNQEDWEYDCRVASIGVKLHFCATTLVTIRRHNQDHLGNIESHQNNKLTDKSKAYLEIHQHAIKANISLDQTDCLRFNRMAFMLARECAEVNLVNEARSLISLCKLSTHVLKRKIEYQTYIALSTVFGWQNTAKAVTYLSRLRS